MRDRARAGVDAGFRRPRRPGRLGREDARNSGTRHSDMEGHVKSTSASGRSVSRWLETRPRAGTDDGNHPDIRGSAEPVPQSSETSPPSRLGLIGASWLSQSVLEDSRRELPTSTAPRTSCESSCNCIHALTDGPDETRELTADRGHGFGSTDAAIEMSVASMKSVLSCDRESDQVGWDIFESPLEIAFEARREASVVRGLDQNVAKVAVAGTGDSALASRLAAGMLADRQPGERHEARCIREAAEIADLGHDGDRGKESDATQNLKGKDGSQPRALFGAALEVGLQSAHPLTSGVHCNSVVLEDELAGRMIEAQRLQPPSPVLPPREQGRFRPVVPVNLPTHIRDAGDHSQKPRGR